MKFHPHINTILASGCLGGEVKIWDISREDGPLLEAKFPFAGTPRGVENSCGDSSVLSLSFHDDGGSVVVASGPDVFLWKYSQGIDPQVIFTTKNQSPIEILAFPLKQHPNFILLGYNRRSSKRYCQPPPSISSRKSRKTIFFLLCTTALLVSLLYVSITWDVLNRYGRKTLSCFCQTQITTLIMEFLFPSVANIWHIAILPEVKLKIRPRQRFG